MTIIFTIIDCLLINIIAKKIYPEINGVSKPLDNDTKKEIIRNVSALSLHKICGAIVTSTDNILISLFIGIEIVGAYSNYSLIISSIISLIVFVSNGITSSVGNLVASSNKEYSYKKFKQINLIFAILSSFSTICLIILLQPFINIWTGGGQYLLDFSTVILISFVFYLGRMRIGVGIFKECTGLFYQDIWKPFIEASVNLIASIAFVKLLGINGIFIGTIISTMIAPLWIEPMVLYKHYFKKPVINYFKTYLRDVLSMLIVGFICFITCSFIPDGTILWLILKFGICGLLTGGLLVLAYLPTKDFREGFALIKNMVKSTFKKNKKDF